MRRQHRGSAGNQDWSGCILCNASMFLGRSVHDNYGGRIHRTVTMTSEDGDTKDGLSLDRREQSNNCSQRFERHFGR